MAWQDAGQESKRCDSMSSIDLRCRRQRGEGVILKFLLLDLFGLESKLIWAYTSLIGFIYPSLQAYVV